MQNDDFSFKNWKELVVVEHLEETIEQVETLFSLLGETEFKEKQKVEVELKKFTSYLKDLREKLEEYWKEPLTKQRKKAEELFFGQLEEERREMEC